MSETQTQLQSNPKVPLYEFLGKINGESTYDIRVIALLNNEINKYNVSIDIIKGDKAESVNEFWVKDIDADFKHKLIKSLQDSIPDKEAKSSIIKFTNSYMASCHDQRKQMEEQEKTKLNIEDKSVYDEAMTLIKENRLIEYMLEVLESHQGELGNKMLLILSDMHAGVKNLMTPLHIQLYGNYESGKTDLIGKNKRVIPDDHLVHIDSITSKSLYYADIKPYSFIVLNDIIIADSIGGTLNQICDAEAYKYGFNYQTVIEGEAKTKHFPKGCIVQFSSNKKIRQYYCESVDTGALESRFTVSEKYYTDEQKREISTAILEGRLNHNPDTPHKISVIKRALKWYYDNPVDVKTEVKAEEYEKYDDIIDLAKIRESTRIGSFCQCLARYRGRNYITAEDVKEVADLIAVVNPKEITQRQLVIYSCIPPGKHTYKQLLAIPHLMKVARSRGTARSEIRELQRLGKVTIEPVEGSKEYVIERIDINLSTPEVLPPIPSWNET